MKLRFILKEPPYGNKRNYNGLRLAGTLATKEGVKQRLYIMANAVTFAKKGQKVPQGYNNIQLMLNKVIRAAQVAIYSSCMDARGLANEKLSHRAKHSTLAELADSLEADKGLGI